MPGHRSVRTAFLALSTACVVAALPAAPPSCLEEVARWGWTGIEAVAVEGDTLVLGAGSVLVVVDVGDPTQPVITGTLTLHRQIEAIELAGELAIVSAGDDGTWTVSLADRSAPRLLQRAWAGGALHLEGGRLVAARPGELAVLDVADPERPLLLGRLELPALAPELAVVGSTAYVGSRHDPLRVVDLSDPSRPRLVTQFDAPAVPLAAEEDLLAAAGTWDLRDHLYLLDVSEPLAPEIASEIALGNDVSRAALLDRVLHVGSRRFDVSDPRNPVEMEPLSARFRTPEAASTDLVVTITGEVDVSLYARPLLTPVEVLASITTPSPPASVAAGGDLVWVLDHNNPPTSTLLDLGPPLSVRSTPDVSTYHVATDGRLAVVSSGRSEVTLLDVGPDGHAGVLGQVEITAPAPWYGGIGQLALDSDRGRTALVVYPNGDRTETQLFVLDVSDPAAPRAVPAPFSWSWQSMFPPFMSIVQPTVAVAVRGSLAAAAGRRSVTLLDVSNPRAPVVTGELPGWADGLYTSRGIGWDDGLDIAGDLVLASAWGRGLAVIDAANPHAPVELSVFPQASGPLAAGGTRALVHAGELRAIELGDPLHPVERGRRSTPDTRSLDLIGDLLVSDERDHGIAVYDVGSCFATQGLVADFAWSPDPPRLGEVIQLADRSTGGAAAWLWELPDGSTTTERDPRIVLTDPAGGLVRLVVSDGERTASAARWIAAGEPAAAPPLSQPSGRTHRLLMPRVQGARLDLVNPTDDTVTAWAYALVPFGDGSDRPGVELSIPPRSAIRVERPGLRLFGPPEVAGALVLLADGPLRGAALVQQTGTDGRRRAFSVPVVGWGAGAPDGSEAVTTLPGVRQNSAIGLVNLSRDEVTVTVELYEPSGSLLASVERTLAPFSFLEDGNLLAGTVGHEADRGWVRVSGGPAGLVSAHLLVPDRASHDQVFVGWPGAGAELVVPVAVHADGVHATGWTTDLDLVNTGDEPLAVTVSRLVPGGPTIDVTIPPRGTSAIEDVLGALTIDGGPVIAPLRLTADRPTLLATSRTSTPALVEGGSFGQAVPAVAEGASTAILAGLREDPETRTNLGITNLTGEPLEVTLELYDAAGTALGSRTIHVSGWGHVQLNRVLRRFVGGDVQDAWARLSTAPEGRFVAYASIVDNASEDPVLHLGRPD